MKKIYILLLLIGTITTGCNTSKYCNNHGYYQIESNDSVVHDSVVEKIHDTLFKVNADSSWLFAWLECDSLGQVHIRQIEGYKAGVHSGIPQVKIVNNYLQVKTKVDEFSIFVKWRSKDVYREVNKTKVYIKITNVLKGWQPFFHKSGIIAWLIVLVAVIVYIVKKYLKKYIPFLK